MADEVFMRRCLELAERGKGYTAPNPMVGALLVHNGRVIGEGWHRAYGKDHAEVDCLNNVAEEDRHLIPESTMYVNLEPCAHHGKTPPCAGRLVQERVKKVVIANRDPFDQVNGKGIEILKTAGVEVETGLLDKEGKWLNRRFFTFHAKKRPYIILKWAQTPDGCMAPPDKSRLQITNSHSMQLLHKWRTEEAAIMVGTTTAINDNPQLTARLWKGKQPLRIVLDRSLKIPATHHIFDGATDTWVVNEVKNEVSGNVKYVQLVFDDTILTQLCEHLYKAAILSLIVEGGAQLLNNMISAGLWEEARIFTGGTTLHGGLQAPHLQNGERVIETNLVQDRLDVYINNVPANAALKGLSIL